MARVVITLSPMKKKLLICGGTGFIGRNLVETFSQNPEYEVFATHFQRKPFEQAGVKWIHVDLRNPDSVEKVLSGMDIVFQAAATTSGSKDIVRTPSIHVTDNAVMNSLLFRGAQERGVSHFVFFSCTVMYPTSDQPLKETDFDANQELHRNYFGVGWTKVYLEKMAEFYSRLGKTKFTVLRHSNIYGPHDKFDLERSHVFGATVTKVMKANQHITVWGSGEEGRDLLYVDDLTGCVKLSVERQNTPFLLLNVGAGKAVTINQLVSEIIKVSGKQLDIRHDLTKPTIPTSLCLDCSLAKETIGWEPQTDLITGIEKTLQWYRKNLSA